MTKDQLTHTISLRDPYPGHPVVIAMQIMHTFPSLEAATARESCSSDIKALTSSFVNGAGSHVHLALDVLKGMFEHGPETAFAHGVKHWEKAIEGTYYGGRLEEGNSVANQVKELFLKLAASWPKESPTPALATA